MHTAAPKYVFSLDTLRGLAILSVVVFHLYGGAFGRDRFDWAGMWPDWSSVLGLAFRLLYPLAYGWAGVSLFFVLSGYLIHRSFLLSQSFTWRQYAGRRFLRVYPAYLVALVGFALWLDVPLGSWQFWSHVLLVHNVQSGTFFGINPSFWSLAVEAQFYLLYPLALWLRSRLGAGGMFVTSACLAVFWVGCSAVITDWSEPPSPPLWSSPIARWPDWLLGAFIAERHVAGRSLFTHPWRWAAMFAALTVASTAFKPTSLVCGSLAAVACGAALEGYLRSAHQPSRVERWLRWVGLVSYSAYLLHQPLVPLFFEQMRGLGLHRPPALLAAGLVVYVPLLAAVSYTSYCLFERPFLVRRRGRDRACAPTLPLRPLK